MRKRLATILATLMVSLGLTAVGTLAVAPVANAATCGYKNFYDSVPTDGGSMTVRASVYSCDYGSYVRMESVAFYFNTTWIRKLYDIGASDANVRVKCNGSYKTVFSSTPTNYYNGNRYYTHKPYCAEPAYFVADLTADTTWYPDQTYYAYNAL